MLIAQHDVSVDNPRKFSGSVAMGSRRKYYDVNLLGLRRPTTRHVPFANIVIIISFYEKDKSKRLSRVLFF